MVLTALENIRCGYSSTHLPVDSCCAQSGTGNIASQFGVQLFQVVYFESKTGPMDGSHCGYCLCASARDVFNTSRFVLPIYAKLFSERFGGLRAYELPYHATSIFCIAPGRSAYTICRLGALPFWGSRDAIRVGKSSQHCMPFEHFIAHPNPCIVPLSLSLLLIIMERGDGFST